MTFERDLIIDFYKYEQPSKIYLGDNRATEALGEGKMNLLCYNESNAVRLTLNKVLAVCAQFIKELVVCSCYDANGSRSFIQ